MSNHQLLDNITHKDLRIITDQHPQYGDTESYARLVVSELKYAQTEYPVFFHKNAETGQFELLAMFGFDVKENLFLDDDGWHAHYLPLSVQRRPFLIGFQQATGAAEQPVVHVDMDSPRISQDEGEPVFLPQGGQSPYLQHIASVLDAINSGQAETKAFIDALLELDLIEPVDLKVQLDDGSNHQLGGLYTIHQENLAALGTEQLGALHQQGFVEHIYMICASVHKLTSLIEMKNKTL